jgi:Arc/MetJ family transcription regulator
MASTMMRRVMRTTIDIDEALLAEAEKITGKKGPSKTVNFALGELVRRQKLKELREMLGTMDLDDNWRENEQRELEDMRRNEL